MAYFVFAQKVGTKNLKSAKPRICRTKEIAYEVAINLRESKAYCRITIEEDLERKIYDWHMNAEDAQKRTIERAEYDRKRKELKDKIAELEAELDELDKEWFK